MLNVPHPLVVSTPIRNQMQRSMLHQKKKARPAPLASGVRVDRIWKKKPDESDEGTNLDMINAVEWMHARRGAKFSPTDRRTNSKLENRSWGFDEISALHYRSLPTWLAEALPSRRSMPYQWLVGAVLGAYRAGAVGCLISYSEGMAALGVGSESTWRRWVAEMESLGLLRTIQTWREDPSDLRPRVFGKTLYVAGRVILDAIASLEGALDRGALDRASRGDAIARRNIARGEAKTRLETVRTRRAPHDSPHLRPRPVLKDSATILIEPTHNRNALPSFVGGDTTPPAVGNLNRAPDAKASGAISSGESLSDSRSTATMLGDLLTNLGHGRSRQAKALLDLHDVSPRRDGKQIASSEPRQLESTGHGQGGIGGLTGPIASQLWAMFETRRRDN